MMVSSMSGCWAAIVLIMTIGPSASGQQLNSCRTGHGLKYLSGDALAPDDQNGCLGPDDTPYPTMAIERMVRSEQRRGRSFSQPLVDPLETRRILLQQYEAANYYGQQDGQVLRKDRSLTQDLPSVSSSSPLRANNDACRPGPGNRLCRTRYNTTAPMYGVSLTSGQPVTIVQKFPDLLQQVIFEVCDSTECDVLQGECVQTYVPYLFLVIPLGPVTLTGQDYVLVENGCVCRPKYGRGSSLQQSQHQDHSSSSSPSLADVLPGFSTANHPTK